MQLCLSLSLYIYIYMMVSFILFIFQSIFHFRVYSYSYIQMNKPMSLEDDHSNFHIHFDVFNAINLFNSSWCIQLSGCIQLEGEGGPHLICLLFHTLKPSFSLSPFFWFLPLLLVVAEIWTTVLPIRMLKLTLPSDFGVLNCSTMRIPLNFKKFWTLSIFVEVFKKI